MNKPAKKQEVTDKVRSSFASNNGQVNISKKYLTIQWRIPGEGVQGGSSSLEPPFETKLFHVRREFSEKLIIGYNYKQIEPPL